MLENLLFILNLVELAALHSKPGTTSITFHLVDNPQNGAPEKRANIQGSPPSNMAWVLLLC